MFHQPFAQPCWQLRSNVGRYYLESRRWNDNADSARLFYTLSAVGAFHEGLLLFFSLLHRVMRWPSSSLISFSCLKSGTGQNECLASCPSMEYMMRFFNTLPTTCNFFNSEPKRSKAGKPWKAAMPWEGMPSVVPAWSSLWKKPMEIAVCWRKSLPLITGSNVIKFIGCLRGLWAFEVQVRLVTQRLFLTWYMIMD